MAATTALDYLPDLLALLTPDKVIHIPSELWIFSVELRTWRMPHIKELRALAMEQIHLLISNLEGDAKETAGRVLRTKAQCVPLIQAAITHIQARNDEPLVWDSPELIAFANGQGYDLTTRTLRPLQASDHIRMHYMYGLHLYHALPSLSATLREQVMQFYTRMASGHAEKGAFLLDATAHALIGSPIDRFYTLSGPSMQHLIQLHGELFRFGVLHQYGHWNPPAASYSYWKVNLYSRYRIVYSEYYMAEHINVSLYREITEGNGSYTLNTKERGLVTLPQRATIFIHHNRQDKCITDPILLKRMVYLDLGQDPPSSELFQWAYENANAIITVMCERASQWLHAVPVPPASVMEDTLRLRKEWTVPTVEEWMQLRICRGEGVLLHSKVMEIYRADRMLHRVESMDKDQLHHILEERMGPRDVRRRGYRGWMIQI